jgi:hypothetical protein
MSSDRPNLSELTDFYHNWETTEDSLIQYGSQRLTADLAISTAMLFCPKFVLHNKGIFLDFKFSEKAFQAWDTHLKGDMVGIQKVINHVHITQDVALHAFENQSYQNLEFFGNALLKVWRSLISTQFPELNVHYVGEKDEFEDFLITFWVES